MKNKNAHAITQVIAHIAKFDVCSLLELQAHFVGDGKIFILPVEDAIRIRTGESDEDAV